MSSIPDDFSRSQLKDRKWQGDNIQVNPAIAKKPTDKNRRCTDILCCFVFLAFLVGMGWATIYGYVNGNPGKLIAPIDSNKNICGYDSGLEDYPKLYIDNIVDAAGDPTDIFDYAVCIKDCPENADDAVECAPSHKGSCQPDPGQGYGTSEFFNYCVPVYETLPEDAKASWEAMKASVEQTSFGGAFANLLEARWILLIGAGLCLVCTLIYIKFMDWCAYWLSWFSVFLIFACLVGSGVWTLLYRSDQIEKDPKFEDSSESTWLNFYAWTSFIAAGIYLLVMVCCFSSLRIAIAVIETAADYFADTKRIIFVPLLFFFLGVCAFAAWVAGMLCVASIGEITVDSVSTQSKEIEWSAETAYAVWYMIFGFIWIVAFLVSCNEFVVIVSAITWYFSDKTVEDDDGIPGDSDVSYGFYWSIRYHPGSLAFGSFILTIVWIIRLVFEYIGEKVVDATAGNGCTKCLLACVHCCLDCFDRFIRYLNRNAFIYMALSGESFCSSALNAFILILKNKAKFAFVEGIADVFMFLAKFFISCATTGLSWLCMEAMVEVKSPFMPLFIIFMLSYMIASVFIAVFDVSANTILQCYLLDKSVAAQQGLADPDHVPPTMTKFFNHPSVQEKMGHPSSGGRHDPDSDEKANLIA